MERKPGELVPIGDALADLPGPVQALRETPPPARRGFTLADQVNQLVTASEADPDRGFMARLLALCSLGGRPSIRLARYFPWIEMRAGDLLVRQRQGAGWRSGGASANTATKSVQRRFSAPLGSFDELFGRPVLVAIHGQGCASSKCCASGIATPIRRAPSRPRGRETRASLVPV